MANLDDLPPLCIPKEVMARYAVTGDSQLLAAALLETYLIEHRGEGTGVFVPEERIIARLAWDKAQSMPPRERIRRALSLIATQERVGARVEHGMVNVWFSSDVEKRTNDLSDPTLRKLSKACPPRSSEALASARPCKRLRADLRAWVGERASLRQRDSNSLTGSLRLSGAGLVGWIAATARAWCTEGYTGQLKIGP